MNLKQNFDLGFFSIGAVLISSSTCHGISNAFNSRHLVLKLMWIGLFLFSSFCGSYLVVKEIIRYSSYSVNTNLEIVYENPVTFPTVSFCNLNPLDKHQRIEDLLLMCSFDEKPCDIKDFTSFNDKLYGDCFRYNFNLSNLKQSSFPGKLNGLSIELFAERSNRPFNPPKEYTENGFRIFIHDNQYEPRMSDGIDISTGFKTNLVVSRQVIRKLDSPYSNCKTIEELKQLNESTTFNATFLRQAMRASLYRQTSCLDHCFKQTRNEPRKPNPPTPQNTKTELKSWFESKPLFDKFFPKHVDNFQTCQPFCPEECESTTYTVSLSFTEFPSHSFADFLLRKKELVEKLNKSENFIKNNNSISYLDLKSRMVSFSVYYDDLKYVKIQHTASMTFFDLISNIGGILGIFLGISFLSFFEIVELIYELIYIICIKMNTKTKTFKLNK